MNTKTFRELFYVERKADSDTWGAEAFGSETFFRGFMEPTAGALGTTRGKASGNSTHKIYAPSDTDIQAGDKVVNSSGVEFIVLWTQSKGITGRFDHMEIDVEQVA